MSAVVCARTSGAGRQPPPMPQQPRWFFEVLQQRQTRARSRTAHTHTHTEPVHCLLKCLKGSCRDKGALAHPDMYTHARTHTCARIQPHAHVHTHAHTHITCATHVCIPITIDLEQSHRPRTSKIASSCAHLRLVELGTLRQQRRHAAAAAHFPAPARAHSSSSCSGAACCGCSGRWDLQHRAPGPKLAHERAVSLDGGIKVA